MRTSSFSILALLLAAAFLPLGCKKAEPPKEESQPAAEAADSTALNIRSDKTPEGVTNHFFGAFFSGKDNEAWSYLTPEAQNATKDSFEAQASDTIRWNVTKVDRDNNNAYVYINVSDLNDAGEVTSEELIFALRNESNQWGVAGFSAGDMIVNLEEKVLETVSVGDAPTRVSQTPSSASAK